MGDEQRVEPESLLESKKLPKEWLEELRKRGPVKSLPEGWKHEVERAIPPWRTLDRLIEIVTGNPAVLARSLVKARGETQIVELIPPLHPDNRDLKRLRKAKKVEDLRVDELSFWKSLDEEQRILLKEYLSVNAVAFYEQFVTNNEYAGTWQKIPMCRLSEISWYKMEGRRLKLTEAQVATVGEVGKVIGSTALAIEPPKLEEG